MAQPKFKPGDVVQLKSGGPKMTVLEAPGPDDPGDDSDGLILYRCLWFDPKERLQTEDFNEYVLTTPASGA